MDKATETSPGDKLTVLADFPTDTKPVAAGLLQAFDVFLQRKIPLDDFRGTLAAAVDRESVVATLSLLEFARKKKHLSDPIYELLVSEVNELLRDDEPTQLVEISLSVVDEGDHDEDLTQICFPADGIDDEPDTDSSQLIEEVSLDSVAVAPESAHEADSESGEGAVAPPASITAGSILRERFEILEEIGSGGMGVVYKAVDKRREEAGSDYPWVAIKVIKECYLYRPAALRALEREASKVQRLSHPNIVNVFDFDRDRERFFITMEWLDGMALAKLLKQSRSEPMSRTLALRVIRNAARGLAHAHKQGVVHADIKPNNIYLTRDQQIKLLDFGIAQAISEPNAGAETGPAAGTIVGYTPGYASCEILAGSVPTSQDDIYALGCIAYRLLTGRHPYGNLNALEAEAEGLSPEPIDALPPGIWESIAQTLKFRRKDRTASVARFLEDFSPRPSRSVTQIEQPAPSRTTDLIQYGILALALIISTASAVAWWFSRDTAARLNPLAIEAAASTEPLVDDSILLAARQAFEEGRLVEPDADNAFHYYTAVLATDPVHAEAVAGIELIFDFYLGRFEAALGNNDIEQAVESLQAARGVKAENLQIAVAEGRLELHATGLVDAARQAARQGDFDRAETLLDQASQVLSDDSSLIATARSAVASQRTESRLSNLFRIANQRIDEDSLVEPANGSAKYYLAQARRTNPNHPELARSTDRLATAMLLKAMLAVSAVDYAGAENWLAEVRQLNVQPAGVARAEQQLSLALQQSGVAQEAEPEQPIASVADVAGSETISGTLEEEPRNLANEPAAGETGAEVAVSGQDIVVAALHESDNFEAQPDLSGSAIVARESAGDGLFAASTEVDTGGDRRPADPLGLMPISAFEISKYVNPRFPLRTKSSSIAPGWVDVEFTIKANGRTSNIEVLESSRRRLERNAVAAVRRWEFVPPGIDGRTQARVPFGSAK